jgi:DNA-binding transcriptional LysR family regulator
MPFRDRWLRIELRHFAALDAIAHERSFRGAGHRLGYVQSAISRQIAYLEEMTGVRLIERSQGPRPVHLTREGELLRQHANDILATIDAAKRDLDGRGWTRRREVRLGVFSGVPSAVLPSVLTVFAQRRADVKVTAVEATTDRPFFDLLRHGRIDIAFTCLPVKDGPFASCELMRVPWVLVVPRDSELSASPTPADLARLPLVGANTARLGSSLEKRLRAEVGELRIAFRSDVPETAQALAAAGVGAAIVPRPAADESDPRTRVVDLGALVPPLRLGLAWHRDRRLSSTVEEFRESARRACSQDEPEALDRSRVEDE